MNQNFVEGFEKKAFLGAALRLGAGLGQKALSGASWLGKKMWNNKALSLTAGFEGLNAVSGGKNLSNSTMAGKGAREAFEQGVKSV